MAGLNWTLKHLNLGVYTFMSTGVLGIPVHSIYIFTHNVLRFPKHPCLFWQLEAKQDIIGHLKELQQWKMVSWIKPFHSMVSNVQKQLSTEGTSQTANYRHLVPLRCIPLDFQISCQRAQVSHKFFLISTNPVSHLNYLRVPYMAQDNCA